MCDLVLFSVQNLPFSCFCVCFPIWLLLHLSRVTFVFFKQSVCCLFLQGPTSKSADDVIRQCCCDSCWWRFLKKCWYFAGLLVAFGVPAEMKKVSGGTEITPKWVLFSLQSVTAKWLFEMWVLFSMQLVTAQWHYESWSLHNDAMNIGHCTVTLWNGYTLVLSARWVLLGAPLCYRLLVLRSDMCS